VLPQVRILGRYALYDEIASGGMATVHIGRLIGPVGFSRTVAIKRLHPQFAKEPDFVTMFLDEARLAARIRHPNVVGTLDVVALGGELFLVMEYVQGESLARLMRTVRERGVGVPIPIASAVIVGVLEGLHAAHEATNDYGEPLGIVHRDISPQNILVGADGVPRVVDFGVAKAAGRMQTTRDGQLKGKLGYMAPEQISGFATRATDVHAAAVVLWEMLTARRLYHGENELQTYSNILAGNILPPSTYAAGVSAELDAVILRALSPNPLARFASAREMARALLRTTSIASASDVGDWVESIAGTNLSIRARKIAAIESAGMMPGAPSSPEPLDVGTSSLPASHSPVSVERLRAIPRRRTLVALPIALSTLAVGAGVGLFLRTYRPALLASVFHGTVSPPALHSEVATARAQTPAEPRHASQSASAWTVASAPVATALPPATAPGAGGGAGANAGAGAVPGAVNMGALPGGPGALPLQNRGWPLGAVPLPPASGAPGAWPAPQPQPGRGGTFAHVMDSRK
jgi:eukaryotic-like serine/threonine-protein kinase